MTRFTHDSPVVQDIMTILRQNSDGLAVPEIRRALLRGGRPGVLERDIEQIVRLPSFRRLPGGKIILQEMESPARDDEEASVQRYADNPSTLRNLKSLDAYIIFDVETNGLDEKTADFFQLSAVKVVDGLPEACFNEYARVDTSTISRAMRVKLHFDELGLETKIQNAGTQNKALEAFCEFAGDLPLVAHNGTFDIKFLRKHRPGLTNQLIDSLELFVLAFPAARSYRIESLANEAGFVEGGERWRDLLALDKQLGISKGLGVDPQALFHSAIFDCLVLHLLFQDAMEKLRGLPDAFKALLRHLSPTLGDFLEAPSVPIDAPTDLRDVIPLTPWESERSTFDLQPSNLVCDESTILNLYNHLLSELTWQPRESQREMIRQVTQHFTHGTQAMIEAPTGTGKTIAYLLPALVQARITGQQTVVSTSTKALQDQLLNDLETRLHSRLPLDFHFAVLKGQNNYLCLTKLWDAFLDAFYEACDETPFEEKFVLLYLLRYAIESASGDLQNTSFWFQNRFPILDYLKAQLCSEGETCGRHCSYYGYCFHPRAVALAERVNLLVVNHSLLLLKKWEEDHLFNLVLDEAHNLEDVATNVFTDEASRVEIEHLLARLLRPDGRRGALVRARRWVSNPTQINRAMGIVRRVRRRVGEFGGYLQEFPHRQGVRFHPKYGASWQMRASSYQQYYFHWQHVQRALNEIQRELNDLREATRAVSAQLANVSDRRVGTLRREFEAIYARLFGLPEEPGQRDLLESIPQIGFDPLVMVHWIELGVRGESFDRKGNDPKDIHEREDVPSELITWAFKRAPVRVTSRLEAGIYQHTRAMILTSATLTLAEGGFNFFLDRLGLEARIPDTHLSQLPKEFNYAEQIMLGMPGYFKASARYDQIEQYKEEMARELACLFDFTEGRGLVLHTARTRMEYVATHLEKALSHLPVYWQRERTSARLLKEEFEAREESVLLGLRSFWEGVDVPGPSLSYLVIEKLPFPVPDDPIIEARREEINSEGGNEWMDYLIPLATLHFKQGFGRLMRKSDDRGVVLFLDKRLRGDTFYRESVLGSLPGYKRTDDQIEAEESRADFYRSIADHMDPLFPELVGTIDIVPCIREEIIPDLERLLRDHEIPVCISEDAYDEYRPNLKRATLELIAGFQDFRPEQDQAMRSILACQDTLVVLPTGSGKSLTFQLPALLRNGVTLVFSPLIALMRDQVDKLREKGITMVDYIVSGQSGAHRDDVYRRMARGDLRLVYIAPERIRDPALAEALRRTNVIQIVVDEAHCVHMWGHSFRPDFLNIIDLFPADRPPIAALTATATQETRNGIATALHLSPEYQMVTKSIDRPELKFIVYNERSAPERIRRKRDKFRVLIKILLAAQRRDENAIVYTSTIRDAEQLSRMLNMHGFTVRHYHGRMGAQDREEVQEMFREGIIKMIVATKAFGMGIDKADVRYVIHYNVPGDLESYFQEAGRSGRDGKTAYCILLYHKSDLSTQQYFIHSAFPENSELNSLANALRARINGHKQILVHPDDLATASGVDHERLGVALHMLEHLGIIRRSFNFAVMANLLLNRSPAWLLERHSDDKVVLLDALITHAGISDKRGIQLDLLAVAEAVDSTPIEIDQLLTELSAKGWAVYRPWERGFTLEVQEKLIEGAQIQLGEADMSHLEISMHRNLRRMVGYAESLGAGDCRRSFTLRHFGETLKERPSPCCDLCNPDMSLPWREISSEEVSDISAEVDPKYLALRVVDWNQSRHQSGYSPYTTGTLTHIIAGNAYAATFYVKDPIKKRNRIKRLERSPYYAVLQGIRGGGKAIGRIFSHLHREAYTRFESINFTSDDGEITYEAPMLTDKGKEQVLSGKYFT